MNFQKLADDLGFELDEFTELVELFVNTTNTDLDQAVLGLDGKDVDAAARAFHSIKGAAGNLGFMEMHETAKKAEADARAGRFDGLDEPIRLLQDQIRMIAAKLSS